MSQLESLATAGLRRKLWAHALWTLEGLGQLEPNWYWRTGKTAPMVREQAIRLSRSFSRRWSEERHPLDNGGTSGGLRFGRKSLKPPPTPLLVQGGGTTSSNISQNCSRGDR